MGVLILAHGGTERWNQTVRETVAEAKLLHPVAIAFGMGMHPQEAQAIQDAIATLEGQGVSRLIVVPLLVSSHSDVMRQYEYLLGLREHGPWEADVKPVAVRCPLVMSAPLDDDLVVGDVLLERAMALSQQPPSESVILVAHGPTTEEDNAQWLATMGRVAQQIQAQGRFRTVIPVTMRDDAPGPVLDASTRQMRQIVEEESRLGRVLVVPLLLANGGIEGKIPARLEGLTYVYQGEALLPHPKLAQWIASRVHGAILPVPSQRAEGADGQRPAPVAHVGRL